MTVRGSPDSETRVKHELEVRAVVWPSKWAFLSAHNGFRPRSMHLLVGTSGSGKSAIAKALVADSSRVGRVLVVLSEGTREEFDADLIQFPEANTENVLYLHEDDCPLPNDAPPRDVAIWIYQSMRESTAQAVVYDNATTSKLYEPQYGLEGQEIMIRMLDGLAKKANIPVFIVAHTKKDVTDNMGRAIKIEDTQGSSTLIKRAQYAYVYQRFEVEGKYFPFIHIAKCRGYRVSETRYALNFKQGRYVSDQPVSFEEMNEVFMKRNVLGRKVTSGF